MNTSIRLPLVLVIFLISVNSSYCQQTLSLPSGITGNFEINSQYYRPDSAIGAPKVPEQVLSNGFMNINYTNNNFAAGIRYESYLDPLQGFDPQYKGSGIMYKFVSFKADKLKITAGSFYDQFGNGLIFRSYEERALGVDNAMEGLHVVYQPLKGVSLKGFIAEQRNYFSLGPGIVRGIDGDFQVNDMITSLTNSKLRIGLGGSFVSKYQKDDSPSRILPENVAACAGRTNLNYGKFSLNAEYAYKYNDPSIVNDFIYKNGEALYVNMGYIQKGLGIKVTAKRIDNMSFRSDRGATGNSLSLNYLPAINKELTYRLSTLYPYATQPNGEMGLSGEVYYSFKPGSVLGGTNGTTFSISGSAINDLVKTPASNDTLGYKSDFFKIGTNRYYQDITTDVTKKINKNNKIILTYIYQYYDKNTIEGEVGFQKVTAHIGVIDYTHKLNHSKSLRFELQHLLTKEDRQNWAMGLVEYSVSPNWSFAVFDEWNYGNDISSQRYHYYNGSFAYTVGGTRISLGYARQRAGLLCVGGVCRYVPASNGANLSITSRF